MFVLLLGNEPLSSKRNIFDIAICQDRARSNFPPAIFAAPRQTGGPSVQNWYLHSPHCRFWNYSDKRKPFNFMKSKIVNFLN